MAGFTSIAPLRSQEPLTPAPVRRRFRDSPRRILIGTGVVTALLVALVVVSARTSRFTPDLLTEGVLYALSAADLAMLAALLFLLARFIIKLVVERRRALPLARFRTRLVALLLGMTLAPAILVLIVGSELIRTNIDRWFNAPLADVLSSANQIAGEYYHERQVLVGDHADRVASALSSVDLAGADADAIRERLAPELTLHGVRRLTVYRVGPNAGSPPTLELVGDVSASGLPAGEGTAAARLAAQAIGGVSDARSIEMLGASGDLLYAAAVVRAPDGPPTGVVVAADYVAGEFAARSHRMVQAFEGYNQLRVLRRPLTGMYLSFFLMVTLLILIGATWTGSYLAKRITRPVVALSAAAREIGAGRLDQRIEQQGDEEFGALVEAFNVMAGELATSRRKLERSTHEIERKHLEVEKRRRYVETILERITTGVVSVDISGAITTINTAASRLLSLPRSIVGHSARAVFDRADLRELGALIAGVDRPTVTEPIPQEIAIPREGQELRLAVVATALIGESGASEGLVLVFDDVTPLIRAQKVAAWREVARRLAHEIKNPLTPIQLSAGRLRRHFQTAPPAVKALVDECTETIVGEVESLKGLVDEFSQFARMPSPKTVPTDLGQLISETVALYNGIFADVRIEQRFAPGLPLVRLDAEQIRRVIINVVDNAIEAMDRRGVIVVETQLDIPNRVVRVVVADDGPGIPAAEREKLFLPYYSTKGRGSGLGLAIVRRIIAEHGGSIETSDNVPHGTRFTIELPC
ncbi:MAG: hypothetical protein A3G76_06675 [Acidobacteria bacterium RIFCSPLOWO2_12_FULL_65_11]|nr:MAG: hypothetical protein A3G76_06675 [Acidobacteria bacterium RIFCSPLOWO2_12_FULL_65_11]